MAEKKAPPPPENPGPEYLYQEGLKNRKFLIQQCDDCGTHIFYARLLCPSCGSDKVSQIEASGGGTVYSTSVVRQRPERGGDYNLALIDLDEGPRMMSRVDGMEPAEVAIGMKVKAKIDDSGDEPLVIFE
ncbi:MAG: Zn-ribbon domain-containing OB-fold protein, partial [Rhodospirillales bacterium]